ncbi:PREDICTED: pentatricopeptide repeat-containing protein At4g13650 [Nicotiana attenuata]|uniref:Pentatricopeptide repeat-containing protein n=1 Tax=Nicotiana attenuata TaxID=49451 RepID=A0A1J6KDK4_NICAT|nr:PREDICTED: pentatricopeptide repeat-containing protein At4g13650 [Nicotiana attenuata]XP_019232281.1 PREDICTED: pentatricopeptide repeat-containing protein At4g13650 [Nicotiana attenuata]XP_019232282.1 PREDICTED: pentatricopeptide repeat-containing protein At4g13650 [Nicotiana attenuata]OIT28165.1 pentatricopeptide repeat-containing protein [Nicotiana attenuata]
MFSKRIIHHLYKSSDYLRQEIWHFQYWKPFRLNNCTFTTCASINSLVLDDFSDEENVYYPSIIHSHIAKDNGYFDHTYYLSLLGSCLSEGSIVDAKKLHGKLLKLGFGSDYRIGARFLDIYVAGGDLSSALQIFDNLPSGIRNVSCWNILLSGFTRTKRNDAVLNLFSRMLREYVNPDECTFSQVLQACSYNKAAFRFRGVEQIHALVMHCGLGLKLIVCNRLIDLYSKNGLVDSAKQVFEDMVVRDSSSWVAMLSGFCKNERGEDGILLYKDMRKFGVIPTPYVFSSVISASTKIKAFDLGEQLHASIYKWGFLTNVFVGNALVTLYSRCGYLTLAEQVFIEMPQKDGVTYNSLISGLSLKGFSDKALQLFEKMQLGSLKPDCVTIASLLGACASLGALQKGRQLHSYATKAGLCSDSIIEGSLLDLYVKCSDIETAHKFFLGSQMENIVLWNVMLVGYGQMGDLDESFQIFSQMLVKGLQPNQYTYPSILRTCTSVGALYLGEQIHSQVLKTGFWQNVYVCSVLIDMYAKHEKLDAAEKIFWRLNEEDVVSWTSMIAGYAQHDLFVEALTLFRKMQHHGIRSDNIGFASATSACAGIQALDQGRQIHAQSVVSGYSLDHSIGNALIFLYARCGRIQDAYAAFDKIDTRDIISWNGLVSGFAQSGFCEEALEVFSRLNGDGVEANMFTYGSAVSAAANTTNIKQGKQIHARIIKTGYNAEIEASNVLITLYAKCGSLVDARKEFLEMQNKNDVSWNAMITGYSQHGCGNEAIELFEEMRHLGVKPNHVTYLGVLSACSHVGLVDKGLCYFNSMSKDYGLMPKLEHYASVVDILGRAGHLQRAMKFVVTMPIEPDAMVWRTLLSACIVQKNMEIGEEAGKHLLELEPQDSATYVLLSNLYAVLGRWDSRNQTRLLMKDRGVKKEPGRSWIEVKNTIHAFFVGDRLHPLANHIYDFVEELNKRVVMIGYVQDNNSLWNDFELGQKDPTAYIHSEKLAIAFGLLSLPEMFPVRVMKNLRVCNDCHNWIKCVSKVANRAIVVRDAYRFHHFADGDCSCNDFW